MDIWMIVGIPKMATRNIFVSSQVFSKVEQAREQAERLAPEHPEFELYVRLCFLDD